MPPPHRKIFKKGPASFSLSSSSSSTNSRRTLSVLGCSFETKGDTGHWGISVWWTGEEVEGCNIVGVDSLASLRIFLAIVLLVLSWKSHAFLFSCGVMSSKLTLCKFFIQLLMLSSWLINPLRFFSFWMQPQQINQLVRLTLNSRLSSSERTLNLPPSFY